MYVVHDVVDDYPDLASTAIGDLEERHVVVYRTGHHPEGGIVFANSALLVDHSIHSFVSFFTL